MILGQAVVEVSQQLGQLLGKIVGGGGPPVALQREHRQRVGTGSSAQGKIDPIRKERRQHGEGLRDLERAVVGQHHAAASHADSLGRGSDRSDQCLRAGAGQHGSAVMLGHPVAVIAERVGEAGEVQRVAQRLRAGRTLGDR